jgi:putative DNA-invertase from lambdoid prophage Rac
VGQRAALHCRVSTADQSCDRQRDLRALAKRSGFEIVGVYKEKASGAKTDRIERKEGDGARASSRDRCHPGHRAVPMGRSTIDLAQTLQALAAM